MNLEECNCFLSNTRSNRIGYVEATIEVLPELIREILRDFRILKINYINKFGNKIVNLYLEGYRFDEIEKGAEIPQYDFVFTKINYTVKRMK